MERLVSESCFFWVKTMVNTAWERLLVSFMLVAATVLHKKGPYDKRVPSEELKWTAVSHYEHNSISSCKLIRRLQDCHTSPQRCLICEPIRPHPLQQQPQRDRPRSGGPLRTLGHSTVPLGAPLSWHQLLPQTGTFCHDLIKAQSKPGRLGDPMF